MKVHLTRCNTDDLIEDEMNKTIFIIILAAVSLPAQAQFSNGNSMYEWCRRDNGSIFREGVSAYIMGALDSLHISKNKEYSICIPSGVTVEQTRDVFCNYVNKHPEIRHLTAPKLVFQSINEAWPCRE